MSLLEKAVYRILKWFIFMAIVSGMGLLFAFPVKWTWNATMPYLFSLPVLTWGKAWCLGFLSSYLLKSILIEDKQG